MTATNHGNDSHRVKDGHKTARREQARKLTAIFFLMWLSFFVAIIVEAVIVIVCGHHCCGRHCPSLWPSLSISSITKLWLSCKVLCVCCRLKRRMTEVQTTNVDMASDVAASSGRESHHLHCIQSLSAQTALLQAENTELTGKVK